uniref:Uncharacterized protein n=1 Tax=Sus scrofa TaxID=9823 RepID=A0A8D1IPB7_PIG
KAHSLSSSSDSNLSVSVGHFPYEEPFSCENTISCGDMSSSGPSIHFVPPIQGTWQTENIGKLLGRDRRQDDWEQFCKLSITLAWNVDMASDSSDLTANWNLSRDNQQIDKYPKEKTRLTLSKLDGLVQKLENLLENQKDDEDDNSVFPESALEEDSQMPSSSPPGVAQIKSQAIGSQRTNTAETSSISSGPPEEGAPSSTQALSCLNFRQVFHWLRHQVLSSLWGREQPKKAAKSSCLLAKKKGLSHRSKRIQPQESLESGHPIL